MQKTIRMHKTVSNSSASYHEHRSMAEPVPLKGSLAGILIASLLVLAIGQAFVLYRETSDQVIGTAHGYATSPFAQVIALTLGMTVAALFTVIKSYSSR